MTATQLAPTGLPAASPEWCFALGADCPPEAVGGKAYTLGVLIRAGVRVPDGFVLRTEALERHLRSSALDQAIDALCERVDTGQPEHLGEIAAAIRSLFDTAPMSGVLRDELRALARPLLARGSVVVRSSAVGEDSAERSFAGQLDSILHVADEIALERAVLACWASYWSERALFYRAARHVPSRGMGVVVQQQVAARAAGVLFTDAGDGTALVEYTAGLGDRLVAGEIDPARISIERSSRAVRHSGQRCADADSVVVSDGGIDALASMAAELEHMLGGPQDVEWAMTADGDLFVVQSRPITAPLAPSARRPSTTRRVVWSNANVAENFPRPISPLLYSIASAGYTHYFRNLAHAFGIAPGRVRAMEPAFSRIVGVHGARLYYNLTAIHSVLRLAPCGDALAASFDAFVGSGGQAPAPEIAPLQRAGSTDRMRQLRELVVIGARTTWQYLFLGRRITRFERMADAFAARAHPSVLSRLSLEALRALLAEFMEIRCHRWTDAALADAAAMVCHGALHRLVALDDAAGSGADVSHTALLKSIPGVVSSAPVHRLWALSRIIRSDARLTRLIEEEGDETVMRAVTSDGAFAQFRSALDAYLDEWGFRCSEELMLTTPSFQESPAPLITMLRAYARLDADSPTETMARQSEERERATARALHALAGVRARPVPFVSCASVLRVLLPWTHAAIRFRERARLKQALLYSRCRRIALAMGDELTSRGFLDARDEVFWLTVGELDELASGGGRAMFAHRTRELVALRSRTHAQLSANRPPDSFVLDESEHLTVEPAEAGTACDAHHGVVRGVLQGTSACSGTVRGRATVLEDVTQSARLTRGEVLVTRQTDPGWGPVFFLISGLVIERGGMLSHGAILAREFGLPCVVGVHHATRDIPGGAIVTVDGDHGRVHVDA